MLRKLGSAGRDGREGDTDDLQVSAYKFPEHRAPIVPPVPLWRGERRKGGECGGGNYKSWRAYEKRDSPFYSKPATDYSPGRISYGKLLCPCRSQISISQRGKKNLIGLPTCWYTDALRLLRNTAPQCDKVHPRAQQQYTHHQVRQSRVLLLKQSEHGVKHDAQQ